jgi:hypothetical protein
MVPTFVALSSPGLDHGDLVRRPAREFQIAHVSDVDTKLTQEAPRTLGVEPMARCRTPGSRRPRRFREAPQDMGTGSDDDDAETGMRFQCPATA